MRGRAVAVSTKCARGRGTWAAERADFRTGVGAVRGGRRQRRRRAIVRRVSEIMGWWRRRWSTTSYGSCTRSGAARADEADEAKREDERRDRVGATATTTMTEEERARRARRRRRRRAAAAAAAGRKACGWRRRGSILASSSRHRGPAPSASAARGDGECAHLALHQQREYQREHGAAAAARQPVAGCKTRRIANPPDAPRRGSSHGGRARRRPRGAQRRRRKPPAAAEVASAWQARRRTVNLQMLQHCGRPMPRCRESLEMLALAKMAPRRRGAAADREGRPPSRVRAAQQHLSQMKLVGVDDDPEAAWQAFRDVSMA